MADALSLVTSPTTGSNNVYMPWQWRDMEPDKTAKFLWTWRLFAMELQHIFRRDSDAARAEKITDWVNRITPDTPDYANYLNYFHSLVYFDPDVSASDFRAGVLYSMSPIGVLSLGSWAPTALWAGMTAAYENSLDHTHQDAGNLQIWRKGEWLLRELPSYPTGAGIEAGMNGWFHNQLIVNWHGSFGGAQRAGYSDYNIAPSQLLRGSASDSYTYALADLTGEYRFSGFLVTPDVTSVQREMLHVRDGDWIVVHDRVGYPSAAQTIQVWNSGSLATAQAGNRITISGDGQSAFLNVVHPTTPQVNLRSHSNVRIIGGRKISSNTIDLFTDGYSGWLQIRHAGDHDGQ